MKKIKQVLLYALVALVAVFVLSLFVMPLLHPDRAVTKTGIITKVDTAGDPQFGHASYTLTFADGEVIQVESRSSVPIPIHKPVAVTYSAREKQLLGVRLAGPR